jgi:hypothetical protein
MASGIPSEKIEVAQVQFIDQLRQTTRMFMSTMEQHNGTTS